MEGRALKNPILSSLFDSWAARRRLPIDDLYEGGFADPETQRTQNKPTLQLESIREGSTSGSGEYQGGEATGCLIIYHIHVEIGRQIATITKVIHRKCFKANLCTTL